MIPFALELGRPVAAALVVAAVAAALVALKRPPGGRPGLRPGVRDVPRLLFALLAALVAGDLRARDPDPPRLRIFVVDRSRSFEPTRASVQASLDLGARDLDPARDRVAVIAFAATPLVALEPSSPTAIREGARRALAASVDATSSDLGAALDLALDVARSGPAAAEVVLLSDGRDTAGRARAAAARLAASDVPLHAVTPAAAAFANARVVRIVAPARVAEGESARVEVTVEASVRSRIRTGLATDDPSGARAIVGEGEVVDTADADVPLRRTFLVKPSRAGLVTVSASVSLLDVEDAHPADDRHECAILAGERGRAVLVGESRAWTEVLSAASFEVERVDPENVGQALARHDRGPASLVVLHEVEAARAPVPALRDHVDGGGGLVVAGDRHAFGPGEYAGSELEKQLLPVLSGPPDSRSKPLALELVIDGSGSMAARIGDATAGKTRYREAVKAVLPRTKELRRGDRIGVIVFDEEPHIIESPDEEKLLEREPTGDTRIGAALERGLDELALREGRRLLVLVTDGEEKNRDSEKHLESIRVKTAKLGDDFAAALVAIGEVPATLRLLAEAIGSRARVYSVAEAGEQLEKLVKGDLVRGSRGEWRQGRFTATPGGFVLGSYAPVRPKELARTAIALSDPERELPAALAVHQGRVLAVATDLDHGGAALAKEQSFLVELLRQVARRDAADLDLDDERSPGWVRIVARTARTNLLAEAGGRRVAFRPIAPGELEARLPVGRDVDRVRISEGDIPLAAVAVQPESALELAPPRRDTALLEDLVAPCGTVLPDLGTLPRARVKEAQRALAGPLALAALAVLVLEGALVVALERLAARRAARRTFEKS